MVSRMLSGLENFERDSIRYTFRSKLYLLEALTHSSYHANRVTPCYQRLEFLGDAILDFLVTQHLYFRHAQLSPGELTDIRQALVNNNIFATIAVKYKYNKYLKQMSPMWFKTIKDFITKVEDETEERGQDHVSKTFSALPLPGDRPRLVTGLLESSYVSPQCSRTCHLQPRCKPRYTGGVHCLRPG